MIEFYHTIEDKFRVVAHFDMPVIVAGFVAILALAVVGNFIYDVAKAAF